MGVKPGLENLDTRKAYVQVQADICDGREWNVGIPRYEAHGLRFKKNFLRRCLEIIDGTYTVDYVAITIVYEDNSKQHDDILSCLLGERPVDEISVDDDAKRKLRSRIQEELNKMA